MHKFQVHDEFDINCKNQRCSKVKIPNETNQKIFRVEQFQKILSFPFLLDPDAKLFMHL